MATETKNRKAGKDGAARPANSRGDILKAAIRMFAEQPYDAVVIRDIARMANVGNPTIYHFFKSKSGLYREAVLSFYGGKVAKADSLPPKEAPARIRIHAFVLKQLQALANDETFFQLLQRELLSKDDSFKKELAETVMLDLYGYIDDILAGTRFGAGNKIIPTMIMSMILGYFQVARFQKYLPNYNHGEAALLESFADELTDWIETMD